MHILWHMIRRFSHVIPNNLSILIYGLFAPPGNIKWTICWLATKSSASRGPKVLEANLIGMPKLSSRTRRNRYQMCCFGWFILISRKSSLIPWTKLNRTVAIIRIHRDCAIYCWSSRRLKPQLRNVCEVGSLARKQCLWPWCCSHVF